MLRDPEAGMVAAWLAAGNRPRLVPFGISGKVWCFAVLARKSGAWGSFKRYGGKHVPREAFPLIARGALTVAQARVEVAWLTLHQAGPMRPSELAEAMAIYRHGADEAMRALVEIGRAEWCETGGAKAARATGEQPPHWTDFLAEDRRAA